MWKSGLLEPLRFALESTRVVLGKLLIQNSYKKRVNLVERCVKVVGQGYSNDRSEPQADVSARLSCAKLRKT